MTETRPSLDDAIRVARENMGRRGGRNGDDPVALPSPHLRLLIEAAEYRQNEEVRLRAAAVSDAIRIWGDQGRFNVSRVLADAAQIAGFLKSGAMKAAKGKRNGRSA